MRKSAVFFQAIALFLGALSLTAQTFTWNQVEGTNTWDNLANWSEGMVPTNGNNTILYFGNDAAGGGFLATNDIAGAFVLNQLLLANANAGLMDVLAGNQLRFAGTTPQLVQNTNGGFTVANNITNAAVLSVGGSGTGSLTLQGIISGASLAKSGNFVLVLGGVNTFAGIITNTGGTISYAAVTHLGATANNLYLANGAALQLTGTDAQNRTINIGTGGAVLEVTGSNVGTFSLGSGGEVLTKEGSGRLVLANASTRTGGTTVNGGILQLNNVGAAGNGSITINNSSTLSAGANLTNDIILAGGTLFAFSTARTLSNVSVTANSAVSLYDPISVNSNNLSFSGFLTGLADTTLTVTGPVGQTARSLTLSRNNSTLSNTISIVSGGAVTANASNSLGMATVNVGNGGTLTSGAINAMGTSRLTVSAGGVLSFTTVAQLPANSITLNNGAIVNVGANITLLTNNVVLPTAGYLTFLGGSTATLPVWPTLSGNLTITNAASVTLSNAFREAVGGVVLTKAGAGLLLIPTNAPTHTGGTVIQGGTLAWRPGGVVSGQFGSGAITLDGGAFAFNGNLNGTFVLSNNFIVTGNAGTIDFGRASGNNPNHVFLGTVLLNGNLSLLSGSGGGGTYQGEMRGAITLTNADRTITFANSGNSPTLISGSLTQDGTARKLTLYETTGQNVVINGNNSGLAGGLIVTNSSAASGLFRFQGNNAIGGGAAGSVLVAFGAEAGLELAIDATSFGKINTSSTGIIGISSNSSYDIDLTGFNNSIRLGSTANAIYKGTITPFDSVYRLGGGAGTLSLARTNAITGARSLSVGSQGSLPGSTVVLVYSNDYSGGTTISAGILEAQAQGALGTGALTLTGGTLRVSTVNQTYTNTLNIVGNSTLSAFDRTAVFTSALSLPAGVTLTVGGHSSSVSLRDGNLYLTGNISGAGKLAVTANEGNNARRQVWLAGDNSNWTGGVADFGTGSQAAQFSLMVASPTALGTGPIWNKTGVNDFNKGGLYFTTNITVNATFVNVFTNGPAAIVNWTLGGGLSTNSGVVLRLAGNFAGSATALGFQGYAYDDAHISEMVLSGTNTSSSPLPNAGDCRIGGTYSFNTGNGGLLLGIAGTDQPVVSGRPGAVGSTAGALGFLRFDGQNSLNSGGTGKGFYAALRAAGLTGTEAGQDGRFGFLLTGGSNYSLPGFDTANEKAFLIGSLGTNATTVGGTFGVAEGVATLTQGRIYIHAGSTNSVQSQTLNLYARAETDLLNLGTSGTNHVVFSPSRGQEAIVVPVYVPGSSSNLMARAGSTTLIKRGYGTVSFDNVDFTYPQSSTTNDARSVFAVQVNEGTLLYNQNDGVLANFAGFSVGAAGQLGGSGTINADLSVAGTMAPGNSIGQLNVNGNVALGSGSVFQVELALDGSSDKLAVNGGLDLSTLFDTLLLSGSAGLTNYTIATFTAGNLSGTFNSVLNMPGTHQMVYDNALGQIRLEMIPEPSALALVGAGLLLLLAVRRRS